MNTGNLEYQGKVAFISGGSRGIGLSIASALASRGCHIVFSYLRSRTDAKQAVEFLSSQYPSIEVKDIRCNMGEKKSIHKIYDYICSKFNRLDFFIHNAATGAFKSVEDVERSDVDQSISINVKSLLTASKLFTPLMEGRNGAIVSLSSHGSIRCLPQYSAVGIAKSSIESLSRYLAVSLIKKQIRVNVVMSGVINTRSLRFLKQSDQLLDFVKEHTPSGRLGTTEDIAKVVNFLCSEDSTWIIGQVIVADGGYVLMN